MQTHVDLELPYEYTQWGKKYKSSLKELFYSLPHEKNHLIEQKLIDNSLGKNLYLYHHPTLNRSQIKVEEYSYNENQIQEIVSKNISSLTTTQVQVIGEIERLRLTSKSFPDFAFKMKDVLRDAKPYLNDIELKKIYFTVSSLYYGYKAIEEIIFEQSEIFSQNTSKNKLIYNLLGIGSLKAQGSIYYGGGYWYDSGEDWWSVLQSSSNNTGNSSCNGVGQELLTVWAIAVAEPTPIGEIIATAATIYIGGTLIMQAFQFCAPSDSIDYYGPSEETRMECIDWYVECIDNNWPRSLGIEPCDFCLNFCIAQHGEMHPNCVP